MAWRKLGRVYAPAGDKPWSRSHAQIPTPLLLEDRLRVFFATRDDWCRSRTGFVDLDRRDPTRVIAVAEAPAIDLGLPGTHDDRGAMPFCVVPSEGGYRFYYTGWNTPGTVGYNLSIGVCEGDGRRFERVGPGPLLCRTLREPYWLAAPCVLRERDAWRMWLISCYGWADIEGRLEPAYVVKHARSTDGLSWQVGGGSCVGEPERLEAIGRPWIVRGPRGYQMWFSPRGSRGYRERGGEHYRIGYAESEDGIHWTRDDQAAGITTSDAGWDSEMIEYCSIVDIDGARFMLYNGNGFGRSGFGIARWEGS